MDGELRGKDAAAERVNSPYDAYNPWKYRMDTSLEQLADASKYNQKLRTMITRSKR